MHELEVRQRLWRRRGQAVDVENVHVSRLTVWTSRFAWSIEYTWSAPPPITYSKCRILLESAVSHAAE